MRTKIKAAQGKEALKRRAGAKGKGGKKHHPTPPKNKMKVFGETHK